MEIKIDTDSQRVQIGEIHWSLWGLLGLMESIGELREGERIEVTRSGPTTVTICRVDVSGKGA